MLLPCSARFDLSPLFLHILQCEWRSEALYDLQHTTRIWLCWALRRPLLTERPCPALSPALLGATQWRPGCSAVTSSTRQRCRHAFSTCRGTQTLTDSKTHSGTPARSSRDVIQQKETTGHVYCFLREWLHRGAMCKFLHYSDSIGFVNGISQIEVGPRTWMSAWTLFFFFQRDCLSF